MTNEPVQLPGQDLKDQQKTPGNTQISPDVVLRVVLSELEKLSPDDREWVIQRLLTLTRGE